jgi:hypothetical protein
MPFNIVCGFCANCERGLSGYVKAMGRRDRKAINGIGFSQVYGLRNRVVSILTKSPFGD